MVQFLLIVSLAGSNSEMNEVDLPAPSSFWTQTTCCNCPLNTVIFIRFSDKRSEGHTDRTAQRRKFLDVIHPDKGSPSKNLKHENDFNNFTGCENICYLNDALDDRSRKHRTALCLYALTLHSYCTLKDPFSGSPDSHESECFELLCLVFNQFKCINTLS